MSSAGNAASLAREQIALQGILHTLPAVATASIVMLHNIAFLKVESSELTQYGVIQSAIE